MANLNYRFAPDNEKKRCRTCQYYSGYEHQCLLLNRETRGSYVCDGWMPIFKIPLDNYVKPAILQ